MDGCPRVLSVGLVGPIPKPYQTSYGLTNQPGYPKKGEETWSLQGHSQLQREMEKPPAPLGRWHY